MSDPEISVQSLRPWLMTRGIPALVPLLTCLLAALGLYVRKPDSLLKHSNGSTT